MKTLPTRKRAKCRARFEHCFLESLFLCIIRLGIGVCCTTLRSNRGPQFVERASLYNVDIYIDRIEHKFAYKMMFFFVL